MRNHDQIHPSISLPALRRLVAVQGVVFAKATDRNSGGIEVQFLDQDADYFRSTGGGELPIRSKLGGMDGAIVGVSLDSQLKAVVIQDVCN